MTTPFVDEPIREHMHAYGDGRLFDRRVVVFVVVVVAHSASLQPVLEHVDVDAFLRVAYESDEVQLLLGSPSSRTRGSRGFVNVP